MPLTNAAASRSTAFDPEEHCRADDKADELFHEIVRRAALPPER
jgi:hypothetical protein